MLTFKAKAFAAAVFRALTFAGPAASPATTGRVELIGCGRTNAEAIDCGRTNAEAAECARTNAEAIGFKGVWYMDLQNGETYRTAPLKAGSVGPRILMRLATDPETSGDVRGEPLVRADIDSITLTAYSCTPHAVTGHRNYAVIDDYDGITLTVANVVDDTLQPWIGDDAGYNAHYLVPADVFASATDGDYGKLKFEFELASTGEVLTQVIEGKLLF